MKVYSPKVARAGTVKQLKPEILTNPARATHREQLNLLAQAAHEHPLTFATLDSVSRSIVGAGWQFVPVKEFADEATQRQRRKVESFFAYSEAKWDNIKDFQSFPDKLALTINQYRLTGQCAWEIVRDGTGTPVGFDVLSGFTIPNVDELGYFKAPAWTHYPWGKSKGIEYDLDELAYFFNSGVTGNIDGESLYEALMNTSLPSDLFAAISYRSLFENTNAPYNGLWTVDPTVSDEDLDMFVSLLEERYAGVQNYGRNPLVVRGSADFKPITSRNEEDAPYLEGRAFNREEFLGVTGVDGNKLGLTDSANKGNIRETRREFHENTLRPLFRRLEDDIYRQVIVKQLGIKAWMLKFNVPDITTRIEDSSISMRNLQWGINNVNEVRAERGLEPVKHGDSFYIPLNMALVDENGEITVLNQSGGSRENPDGSGDIDNEKPDDPSPEATRPPRDEDPSEADKTLAVEELKTWRKRHLLYLDGKKPYKAFETRHLSASKAATIDELLSNVGHDFDTVKRIFSAAIELEERV